jgi:hypothetical protein
VFVAKVFIYLELGGLREEDVQTGGEDFDLIIVLVDIGIVI